MALTLDQLATLKADIAADPSLAAIPNTHDENQRIADAYNAAATPDFFAWRTTVREAEYTNQASIQGTTWSWPAFIARSVGEQNGWARMFAPGSVNPSLANVRQGFADIFSGTQNNAPAQRTHLQNMSMRRATRAEKLFATGTGTTAAPAMLVFEGMVTYVDVDFARNS